MNWAEVRSQGRIVQSLAGEIEPLLFELSVTLSTQHLLNQLGHEVSIQPQPNPVYYL